ncbi:MAG: TRAP transporter small permease [Planctomycetota bacterium]|jgi:TRAP-type C4-dicarboxylate transport system permease small subunit|nr:TRAP transporter small permease [Planctomycetota bacterium]
MPPEKSAEGVGAPIGKKQGLSKIAAVSGKAASILEQIVRWLAIAIVIVLVCSIFFQVARRTLTGKSIVELEELSIVLAAWVAFLTVAYAVRRQVHVRIEIFIERLPFFLRNATELAINAAILATTAILVYYGYRLAARKIMVPMTVLPVHQGFWYFAFPAGMGLAALFMIDNVIQILNRFHTRKPYRSADSSAEATAGNPGEPPAGIMGKGGN